MNTVFLLVGRIVVTFFLAAGVMAAGVMASGATFFSAIKAKEVSILRKILLVTGSLTILVINLLGWALLFGE